MKSKRRITRFVIMLLLVLAGGVACSKPKATAAPSRPLPTRIPLPTPLPPLPTSPPPGSIENPLVLLFVTDKPTSLEQDAQTLAESVAQETELVVEARLTDNYAESRRALCEGRAHLAPLDALGYLAVSQAGCGSLLYIAEIDGQRSARGQMMTVAGKPVFSVVGFKGFRFCRPSRISVSGWIVPSLKLRANGLNPLTDLLSVVDMVTDKDVVRALLDGRCDVGASALGAEQGLPNANRIKVIEELPPIPNVTLALSLQLDADTRALLTNTLNGHQEELARLMNVETLFEADESEYADLRKLAEDAKLDLVGLGQ
jgi:ABC-type phosphate/phosphonate transport system substrate-binding protein